MYCRLFKNLVFPTLDRLNGTRVAERLRELEETATWSRSELESYQSQKLAKALDRIRDRSSFYREHWAKQSGPSSLHPLLDGLPLTDKAVMQTALDEFPLAGYDDRVIRVNTSGSTGVPAVFLRSVEQESWFWALRMRMWQWAGWQPGTPYMAINLNRRVLWRKRLQDVLFRCTYLSYNADSLASERVVELMKRRRVTHVNAFGSTLHLLAEHMKEEGIENPGVRTLTTTGDNLAPRQREVIEEVFEVPVCDYHGAGGEGVHLVSQCRQGSYHVHPENAVLEILTPSGPAAPGEIGRVVVTQLDNEAMPLVRYDLGDLATAGDDGDCECGRAHPTIARIEGRACDVVRAPNGAVLLPQFFFIGAFKMLENVARYQVCQDDLERVTVKLVAEPGCDRRAAETALRDELARATKESLRVDFEWVDDIPLTAAGKPRAVVSTLSSGEAPESSGEASGDASGASSRTSHLARSG